MILFVPINRMRWPQKEDKFHKFQKIRSKIKETSLRQVWSVEGDQWERIWLSFLQDNSSKK
jgi:hypothetical protein